MLEDEALTHGRLLPKNSAFAEEHVKLPSFPCALLLFLFLMTGVSTKQFA